MAKLLVLQCPNRFENMIARMNSIKSIVELQVSYRESLVRTFVRQGEGAPLYIVDSQFWT